MVDEAFAAIGTAKFDNRSFRLNFEITLAVSDARFASDVAKMFESDFAESVEVDAMSTSPGPFISRLGPKGRVCWRQSCDRRAASPSCFPMRQLLLKNRWSFLVRSV